jgi:hypothetical protein
LATEIFLIFPTQSPQGIYTAGCRDDNLSCCVLAAITLKTLLCCQNGTAADFAVGGVMADFIANSVTAEWLRRDAGGSSFRLYG